MGDSPTRSTSDSHSVGSLRTEDLNGLNPGYDSDISLQSGDPDKYWWIRGDNVNWLPPEWQVAEGASRNEPSSEVNPRILELEEITREMEGRTRYLKGRVQLLEDDAQVREAKLERVSTVNSQLIMRDEVREGELTRYSLFNDELAERVVGLCTYICTRWATDAVGDARVKRLTRSLKLCRGGGGLSLRCWLSWSIFSPSERRSRGHDVRFGYV